jgi:hypothetical protein
MISRIRLLLAGAIALLLGFPLSEKTFAGGVSDIVGSSINLGLAIADSAGDS